MTGLFILGRDRNFDVTIDLNNDVQDKGRRYAIKPVANGTCILE